MAQMSDAGKTLFEGVRTMTEVMYPDIFNTPECQAKVRASRRANEIYDRAVADLAEIGYEINVDESGDVGPFEMDKADESGHRNLEAELDAQEPE